MIAPEYTEEAGARVMSRDEFCVRIELGRGSAQETVWTCDFSYDYVKHQRRIQNLTRRRARVGRSYSCSLV